MKKPNNLTIGIATAAAIATPFIPKTINITVNDPPAIIAGADPQMCTIFGILIDDKGKRYCEYKCGTKMVLSPSTAGSCENSINEKLIAK
jgi:hypothetical protein